MKQMILDRFRQMNKSVVLKNSFWGIGANIFQNLFLSLFFVIVAREYNTEDFAQYLIVTALYQLMAALSTMGLSQWFVREVVHTSDKAALVNRFFKIQLSFGIVFYFINLILALVIYSDRLIHIMAVLFGFNIILDNLIYAIKALNVAEFQQKKTSKILVIESVLLFVMSLFLFVYPFSIVILSALQVIIRFFTINLFIRIGSSNLINLKSIAKYSVKFSDIKKLIYANWTFVIIGSVSLIYWRSANIIISKLLTLTDVAIYGISYKLFQLAIIIPLIVSTSVFPSLVKIFKEGDNYKLKAFYEKMFIIYFLYGLLAYTFVYAFADFFLPLIFGKTYDAAPLYTKQMFLTLLVFPTAILQANMLVAINLERFDMIFNVISLLIYLTLSLIVLQFYKSLSVINLSIFVSFIIFHILQDVLLIRKKLTDIKHVLFFYLLSFICIGGFFVLAQATHLYIAFFLFWALVGIGYIAYNQLMKKRRLAAIAVKSS